MQKSKSKTLAVLIATMFILSIASLQTTNAAITGVSINPTSGPVGTVVTVSGSGAAPGQTVNVYWDGITSWDGTMGLLNSTTADYLGNFECEITVPEAYAGDHSVIAAVSVDNYDLAIFTVEPEITLSPTSGLPEDTVTVEGTGFGAEENITLTFDGTDITPEDVVTTSDLGSFSTTFEVPDLAYGDYTVTATDTAANVATATFTIGAAITLSPTEGPAGALITINGRGFTNIDANVTVTIDGTSAPLVENIPVADDGTISGQFIVPSLAVGDYVVTVTDTEQTATADFSVTGETEIEVSPTYGPAGSTINVWGYNFTNIAGTEVTLALDGTSVGGTYTTDSSGYFYGTFQVPAVATGTYTLTATDENDLEGSTSFRVGTVVIIISPDEGPTGVQVTVTGTGFTGTVNGTMDDTLVFEGISATGPEGLISTTFIVPTLDVGLYTLTVTDTEGITATATFDVTHTTTLSLTPAGAPAGKEITVEGFYFTAIDGTDVPDWYIYNSTWSDTLTVSPATPETNGTGYFTCTFTVPDLALGVYTINATDANGLWAEASFTISAAEVYIYPRATEYVGGDTVSFYIKASFAQVDACIEITDPAGYPFGNITLPAAVWTAMDGYQVVPYQYASVLLPTDAALGSWSWTAYDSSDEELASGSFTVVEKVKLQDILDKLDEIDATVVSISDGMATVTSDIGTVKTSLESINAAITSVQGDVATIKTDVGSVKTSLSDINAKIASIDGTVATINTDVGSLKGTITSISGDVATIKTDIGTVKMDVSAVKSDASGAKSEASAAKSEASGAKSAAESVAATAGNLTTLLYVAIIFSALAFIVAIVSVVQLSRKIA